MWIYGVFIDGAFSPILSDLMENFDPTVLRQPSRVLSVEDLTLFDKVFVFRCVNPPTDNLLLLVDLRGDISNGVVGILDDQPTFRSSTRYRSLVDVWAAQSRPSIPSLLAR